MLKTHVPNSERHENDPNSERYEKQLFFSGALAGGVIFLRGAIKIVKIFLGAPPPPPGKILRDLL